MSIQLYVDDRKLQRALSTYAMRRNKNDAEVVNKAMRYLLPFAAKRVRDKTPGERRVLNDLRARPQNDIGRKMPSTGRWGGRLAAAIVASRLKKRGALSRKVTPNFFDLVDRFVAAKQRSVNFLRAGFIPAFRQFEVPSRAPRGQKRFKGFSKGIKATFNPQHLAEAFSTNKREGAFKIAPQAFHEAVRDVRRVFTGWLRSDVMNDAKRSGFF